MEIAKVCKANENSLEKWVENCFGGERKRKSLTALLHRGARSFFNKYSFSFEFPLEFKSFPLVFPIDE